MKLSKTLPKMSTDEYQEDMDDILKTENALIAAAPELLEALREMLAISLRVDDLAWAEAVGKGNGIGPCDKARQAIAKVEGEK